MDNDEDLADDDEHMYLDWVPLEEEDGPRDSDIGEITSETDMDDLARITTYYRLIVLVLYVIRLTWVSKPFFVVKCM